ncbi:MAG: Succinylglutamate desuccinylase / Aspartoacylase family protein [Alphaproteobacteria bacterium ADurb.Bin438]|nr:MAG: Succinylglutamate desuccinylase / Aspartoacylase family protein [Alphaproteobacteria bacterium ADurb.Bin438]
MVVPCANPVSWTQRAYFSTNGKFDFYMGKDWNRNFPGKEDGTLGERIANILICEAKKADFSIDLHTSRQSIPFTIFSKDDYIPFLKIMGIEHNQFIDMGASPSYKNTLNSNLDGLGVDNICIECGSHDAYEPKNVSDILLGIKRLLKSFDMIKGGDFDENSSKIKIFRKGVTYKANKGCLIRLAKELGEQVKSGDDLYYYYDNNDLGNIVAHKSEHEGILFKVSPTHIYWSGDDVLQLLLNDGVEEV